MARENIKQGFVMTGKHKLKKGMKEPTDPIPTRFKFFRCALVTGRSSLVSLRNGLF